jgi:hypothetical protein
MSVNRSVAAAQRRRATPQPPAPPSQNRGPQPSINSAQAFANQLKTGQAPKIPVSKMSVQQPPQQDTSNQGLSSLSKMTIAQAITLITLRLGKVETQLHDLALETPIMNNYQMSGANENMILVDKGVIESINSRLESLEKRSSVSSGPEVALLKQQVEGLKPLVSQNKTAIVAMIKDLKDLKTNVTTLSTDLNESKELVSVLQNLTMDNSQKIMDLNGLMGETDLEGHLDSFGEEIDTEAPEEVDVDNDVDSQDKELLGTDLKNLIEQELAETD